MHALTGAPVAKCVVSMPSSLSNFHPISVLPVFSKILERVVSDQIIAYFNKHDLFSQRQSGFRF